MAVGEREEGRQTVAPAAARAVERQHEPVPAARAAAAGDVEDGTVPELGCELIEAAGRRPPDSRARAGGQPSLSRDLLPGRR